uniref:Uncharacterized protein n=1 Tax=Rousettus aegyptiacus TaxID=9407 RepID=A0A7J8HSR2_ROUAE|nr:hypothetical protein HJG63_011114 [Rousettus aegyptiacus]
MLRVEREPRSGPCTLGRPRTRGAVRFAGPSSPDAACAVPASLPTPARWQPRGAPHSARGPRGTSPTPGSVRSPRPARGVCFSRPGDRGSAPLCALRSGLEVCPAEHLCPRRWPAPWVHGASLPVSPPEPLRGRTSLRTEPASAGVGAADSDAVAVCGLCISACSASPLASAHWMPVAAPTPAPQW